VKKDHATRRLFFLKEKFTTSQLEFVLPENDFKGKKKEKCGWGENEAGNRPRRREEGRLRGGSFIQGKTP